MESSNLVVLRGVLSSAPTFKSLASGSTLVSLEVSTREEGERARTVPVAFFDAEDPDTILDWEPGHEVVVAGSVSRRFFQAGAGTGSRTEVVASRVVSATHKSKVKSLLGAAAKVLAG